MASRALDVLLKPDEDRTPRRWPVNLLRQANGGTNAPLTAQYVYLLLHALPKHVARYPRGSEFRRAAAALMASQPLSFVATRTDIETGLLWLKRNALLPPWVVYGGRDDR